MFLPLTTAERDGHEKARAFSVRCRSDDQAALGDVSDQTGARESDAPPRREEAPSGDALTRGIVEYVRRNYTEKISLSELAFLFGTNRTTLCRNFRAATGKTIVEYMNGMKIREAKRLMREGGMTFTQIAEKLGFESLHYFTRVFKRRKTCLPRIYPHNKAARRLSDVRGYSKGTKRRGGVAFLRNSAPPRNFYAQGIFISSALLVSALYISSVFASASSLPAAARPAEEYRVTRRLFLLFSVFGWHVPEDLTEARVRCELSKKPQYCAISATGIVSVFQHVGLHIYAETDQVSRSAAGPNSFLK